MFWISVCYIEQKKLTFESILPMIPILNLFMIPHMLHNISAKFEADCNLRSNFMGIIYINLIWVPTTWVNVWYENIIWYSSSRTNLFFYKKR